MNNLKTCRQAGLVTVEFAIIGSVFIIVLFAIIEMGRFLYTWNVLDEVTRRAARLAAVCPMAQEDNVRQNAAINAPGVASLNSTHVSIEYLDASQVATNILEEVRYVRTSIQDYPYQMLIPLLPLAPFNASAFTTTLPSESLGITTPGSWTVDCTGA
ncbi:TadE/TadG family type IV pilus assembly protein [Aliamphritea hakodatensis]|uniref:TadE/TadG family type IV pilus assembly protein n=1 Tax=Aliamphritea hakodatensis TaxID=2895352 RepID=UPI0022FD8948|nr:TadE family protein [Aliamphritea hakodatensis]